MSVSITYRGRLGNNIVTYLMAQYLAHKNDLVFENSLPENIDSDFIVNRISGKKTYDNFVEIVDANVLYYINTPIQSNIHVNDYFQWKEIFEQEDVVNKYKTYIIPKPIETNCDLFVGVRLGDIKNVVSLPFEYYSETIEKIDFKNGVISSDSPNDEIVLRLMEKYNLKLFHGSPSYTIRYASQCKNIVLSSGTFCFLQGFFSNNSKVYFIDDNTMEKEFGVRRWTGGMFNAFLNTQGWIPFKK